RMKLIEGAITATSTDAKVSGHIAIGTPWVEILRLAAHLRADLLVMGTRGLGPVKRLFLGSVASQIVPKAACPVFVARPVDYHTQDVPEIEPPCADCVAVQRDTAGAELFCAPHKKKKHFQAHTYYEVPESFGKGWQTFQG